MEGRFNALVAQEQTLAIEEDPAPDLERAFDDLFGDVSGAELERLGSEDVRFYLRAADILAFYTFDPRYLDEVEHAFKVLESRNSVGRADLSEMFSVYVEFRELERAAALVSRNPGFQHEPLPEYREIHRATATGPTVLSLDEDGIVSRVPATFARSGPQVVVAAHPLCHFSEDAIRDIAKDTRLATLFAGRTLWLMPQDRHLDVDAVRAWNREFPGYQMQWAYRTADWPTVKRWATPSFYFYRDGKLVETVNGWPEQGERDALLAAFAKIGVEAPGTPQSSR